MKQSELCFLASQLGGFERAQSNLYLEKAGAGLYKKVNVFLSGLPTSQALPLSCQALFKIRVFWIKPVRDVFG